MTILGKPWYQSLTVWGLAVFVGAQGAVGQLCDVNLLSIDTCVTVQAILQKIGGVLVVLGLRRAALPPVVEPTT